MGARIPSSSLNSAAKPNQGTAAITADAGGKASRASWSAGDVSKR